MAKKKSRPTAFPAGPAPSGAAAPPDPGPLAVLEGPRGRFAWLGLFLVLFPLYLTCASREFGGGLGGDNVVYYLLGKALATGQGYVDLYLPGNPPHSKYPPVLPILLAPFHLLFDQPLLAMHVMLVGFNAAAVVLAGMLIARQAGSRRMGLAAALLFGLGSRMYLQNLHLLSEPPYMFFSCLALLLLPAGRGDALSPGRVAGIGLCAAAAFFTRTMGISVVAAIGAGLWLCRAGLSMKGRRLPAAPFAVGVWVVLFIAWMIRNRTVGAEGSYLDELLLIDPYHPGLGSIDIAGMLSRLGRNFLYYYQQAAIYLVADYNGSKAIGRAGITLGLALPVIIFVGFCLSFRRGERAVATFCATTIFIVLAWSFQDPRFLAPAWPFFFWYLLTALDGLGRIARLRRPWVPAGALVGIILMFELAQLPGLVRMRFANLTMPSSPVQINGYPRPFAEPILNYAKYEMAPGIAARPGVIPQRVYFMVISRVAAELTPPGSLILSRKPMYTYVLSGRQSVPLSLEDDPEKQWDYLVRNRVDYIVTGVGEEALQPTLLRYPKRFAPVASINKLTYLIRVVREPVGP